MTHYKDCYDNNGKIIYENSLPKLHQSPLEGGVLFHDDILVNSTAQDTYAKTVEKHYGLIKKVMAKQVTQKNHKKHIIMELPKTNSLKLS